MEINTNITIWDGPDINRNSNDKITEGYRHLTNQKWTPDKFQFALAVLWAGLAENTQFQEGYKKELDQINNIGCP